MTPAEARAAALRAFGPVARIEEECRDTRRVAFVQNLAQDLRYTLRSLGTAAAASAGRHALDRGGRRRQHDDLQSGLRAAVLHTVRARSRSARPHPDGRQQPRLVPPVAGPEARPTPCAAWRAIRSKPRSTGAAQDQSVSLMPLIVTANFFDVLGVPVAMGRGFTAAEAARRTASRRRGDQPRVLAETTGRRCAAWLAEALCFNGRPYTVLGVLPATFRALPGYGVAPEVYLPLSRQLMPDLRRAPGATVELVGRLHDGQTYGAGPSRPCGRRTARRPALRRQAIRRGARSSLRPAGSAGWATSRNRRRILRRAARGRLPRPGDCLRQRRRPAAGAQHGPAPGDRGARRAGRQPIAAGPTTPDRRSLACAVRHRRGLSC